MHAEHHRIQKDEITLILVLLEGDGGTSSIHKPPPEN